MNFTDISISGSAAVGIGSSVQLTFSFPEVVFGSKEEDELAENQLNENNNETPANFEKTGKTT